MSPACAPDFGWWWWLGDKHEEKEAGRSREEEKGFAGRRIETCNG